MVFTFHHRILRSDRFTDLGFPHMACACIHYSNTGEDYYQLSMAGSTEGTRNRNPSEVLDCFGICGAIFQQLSTNYDWWRCNASFDTAIFSKESTKSVVSVFVDRMIGVFALAVLAVIALTIGFASGQDVSFYVVPVLLVFFLCSIGVLLIFSARMYKLMDQLMRLVHLDKAAVKLEEAYNSFSLLRTVPRVLVIAFLASLLLQINVILFYYFIGVSLDLGVSFLYFAMIVPVALVVLLVPFSINGIGIREGIFVYLLTGLGVENKDAIALSWISFGLMLTQGIIGGIIFALRGLHFGKSKVDPTISQEPNS